MHDACIQLLIISYTSVSGRSDYQEGTLKRKTGNLLKAFLQKDFETVKTMTFLLKLTIFVSVPNELLFIKHIRIL